MGQKYEKQIGSYYWHVFNGSSLFDLTTHPVTYWSYLNIRVYSSYGITGRKRSPLLMYNRARAQSVMVSQC